MKPLNHQPIVDALADGPCTVNQIVARVTKLNVTQNPDAFVREGIKRLLRREQITRTRGANGDYFYQLAVATSEA